LLTDEFVSPFDALKNIRVQLLPMNFPQPELNKFFVCPQYSIYYRRLKKLEWLNEAPSNYGLLHLLAGSLKVEVNGNSSALLHDQSLLLEPAVTVSATGQKVELLLVTLAPVFVMDHAVRMRLVGPGATFAFQSSIVERDERLNQLTQSLIAELVDEGPGSEIVIGALLDQLVVELLRQHSNMRRSEKLELSRVGLLDRRIRRSVELMHARIADDLSLRDIAGASYLSPFHFARLFKKLTGATPHAYLAGIRIARAESLLAEAEISITEISSRVGYSSPSHFTKAFRQATGLTPRAFRLALVAR
jgi:AraC-like DNA-binding protein